MSLPKVSIVIPSYKPDHFEQCLRSALGQTYPHIEILVSDNCPTEAIRDICARFPSVLYQRNTAIGAENVVSSLFSAKGDYIKPLFDDDLLHPFCVERMVEALNNDAVQLVFSASHVISIDNMRLTERRPFQASGTLDGREVQRMLTLGMVNFIGEFSSIMFRRSTLWKVGAARLFTVGEHDCTQGLADVAAYCNFVDGGQAQYIDEELSYFRRDPRLASNSNPATNPHLGNCQADGIDLMVQAHRLGVISLDELLGTRDHMANAIAAQPGVPALTTAYDRYQQYLHTLKD